MAEAVLQALVPVDLLEKFTDDEACWFDHHGNCQAHGQSLEPGERCPAVRLREVVTEAKATAEGSR